MHSILTPSPAGSTLPVDSEAATGAPDSGVTLRVVVICLILAAVFGYIGPIIDYKLRNTYLGATHLPPGAVAVLLLLVGVINPLVTRVSRRAAFSRNEALTVYISCLFSCLIPGHGSENLVLSSVLSPFYYATPENKWLAILQPHLKPWLTPALDSRGMLQRDVVEGWFVGGARPEIPWQAWTLPLLFWGSFVFLTYVMLGCLGVMLRRQWAEHEALSFPLVRLPLQMTAHLAESPSDKVDKSFFRNPMMWSGFGLVVFIQLVRGLNLYFPDIPTIPLELDTSPFLSEAPWNQLGWVSLGIFPIAVGISYLLTSEVAFSLWFFLWFINAQYILAYTLGYPPSTLPSGFGVFSDAKAFTGYQMIGCYGAYVGMVLWSGRRNLWHIVRRALGKARPDASEIREVLSYPVAFWGFVGSFGAVIVMTCLAGVHWDVALALWITYLMFAIGLTRVAVEGGMLFLLHDCAPLGVLAKLFSSGASTWLTPGSGLVPASFFQAGLVVHMRGFLLPSYLHAFKLAYDQKISPRRLAGLIGAVLLVSMSVSWWTIVHLGYDNGALQFNNVHFKKNGSLGPINFITSMLHDDSNSAFQNWIWLGAGATITIGMVIARANLTWFPLHPIGYLMCLTFPAKMLWFSIFLGWLTKALITRLGGVDAARKAAPAFLGAMLGDICMIIFWLAIDGCQGRVGHQLMPY